MDVVLRKKGRDALRGDPSEAAQWIEEVYRATDGDEQALTEAVTRIDAKTRTAVLNLTRIEQDRRPLLEVMAMVNEQLTYALETAALFDVKPPEGEGVGDALLPSRDDVLASIRNDLTAEQARELLKLEKLTLIIYPATTIVRFERVLEQTVCNTPEWDELSYTTFTDAFWAQYYEMTTGFYVEKDEIVEWRYAISEGTETLSIPEWDIDDASIGLRITRFDNRFQRMGISRLNYASYLCLLMQALRQRKSIDRGQCTLLDATDPEGGYPHGGGISGPGLASIGELQKDSPEVSEDVGSEEVDFVAGRETQRIYLSEVDMDRPDITALFRLAVDGSITTTPLI